MVILFSILNVELLFIYLIFRSYGRIEGWLRSSLFQAYEEYSLKMSKIDPSESPITPFSYVLAIDSFVQILKLESQ